MTSSLAMAASAAVIVGALAACSSGEEQGSAVGGVTREQAEAFGVNMVGCLTDKGWKVELDEEDGGVFNPEPIPDEQRDRFLADRQACVEKFGYDQLPRWTREDAEAYYDALVEAADCVRGLGYPVPEAPSRQTVVENLMNGRLPGWNPYEDVTRNPESITEINRVFAECPQPS